MRRLNCKESIGQGNNKSKTIQKIAKNNQNHLKNNQNHKKSESKNHLRHQSCNSTRSKSQRRRFPMKSIILRLLGFHPHSPHNTQAMPPKHAEICVTTQAFTARASIDNWLPPLKPNHPNLIKALETMKCQPEESSTQRGVGQIVRHGGGRIPLSKDQGKSRKSNRVSWMRKIWLTQDQRHRSPYALPIHQQNLWFPWCRANRLDSTPNTINREHRITRQSNKPQSRHTPTWTKWQEKASTVESWYETHHHSTPTLTRSAMDPKASAGVTVANMLWMVKSVDEAGNASKPFENHITRLRNHLTR